VVWKFLALPVTAGAARAARGLATVLAPVTGVGVAVSPVARDSPPTMLMALPEMLVLPVSYRAEDELESMSMGADWTVILELPAMETDWEAVALRTQRPQTGVELVLPMAAMAAAATVCVREEDSLKGEVALSLI
jgi:hypothetical protein